MNTDKDDLMCCLGFVALALGARRDDIENVAMPAEVENFQQLDPDFKFVEPYDKDMYDEDVENGRTPGLNNSRLSSSAAGINDDDSIDDEEREAKLIALFAKHNLELTFVD